jgi:hypothetical protein
MKQISKHVDAATLTPILTSPLMIYLRSQDVTIQRILVFVGQTLMISLTVAIWYQFLAQC